MAASKGEDEVEGVASDEVVLGSGLVIGPRHTGSVRRVSVGWVGKWWLRTSAFHRESGAVGRVGCPPSLRPSL